MLHKLSFLIVTFPNRPLRLPQLEINRVRFPGVPLLYEIAVNLFWPLFILHFPKCPRCGRWHTYRERTDRAHVILLFPLLGIASITTCTGPRTVRVRFVSQSIFIYLPSIYQHWSHLVRGQSLQLLFCLKFSAQFYPVIERTTEANRLRSTHSRRKKCIVTARLVPLLSGCFFSVPFLPTTESEDATEPNQKMILKTAFNVYSQNRITIDDNLISKQIEESSPTDQQFTDPLDDSPLKIADHSTAIST